MNKKKLVALTISALLLIPNVAFAKGNDKSQEKKGNAKTTIETKVSNDAAKTAETKKEEVKQEAESKKEAAQEKKEEKKAAVQDFKDELKKKHEAMKALSIESVGLKKEIAKDKEELSSILEDITAGKKTLPGDQLTLLLNEAAELKSIGEKVNALKEIDSDVAATQDQIKGKDFNSALASLDKVIAKLTQRRDALIDLRDELNKLLEVARTATVPPVDQTTGTTDTTTTGTTTPTGTDGTTPTPPPTGTTGDTTTTNTGTTTTTTTTDSTTVSGTTPDASTPSPASTTTTN